MRYNISLGRGQKLTVRENLIDRLIRYHDPVRAASRLQARFQLEVATQGGYNAGTRTRGKINRGLGDADKDTLLGKDILVSDSRDLYRNNPIAAGAIDSSCMNIVGTGLRPESRIDRKILGLSDDAADELEDQIESEFNYYAGSPECDMSRSHNFWELQYLALLSTLQNGDVLGLFPFVERGGFRYKTKLQLIESDRLSNENFKPDTDRIVAGVERSEFGEPIAYWISNKHPGNWRNKKQLKWTRRLAYTVDGRQAAVLIMHKTRPGQTRGVPYLANVMDSILSAGEYMQSEQKAALVASLFTVFIKKANTGTDLGLFEPDSETGGETTDEDYKMGHGSAVTMGLDEEIQTASPGRPNPNFEGFISSVLTTIGMGIGIPIEFLTKKYNSNYTAARASILDAWRFFMWRRQWIVNNLCNPFYKNWMFEAVANGYIKAPGFFDDSRIQAAYLGAEWTGEPMWHVDPLKEVKAQVLKIETGLSSKKKEARKMGNDIDTVRDQRAKEIKKEKILGLYVNESGSTPNG